MPAKYFFRGLSMIYFAAILVFTIGALIQRVTGFGLGIFAMIFLPYIAGSYGEANVLSGMVSIVFCLIVGYSYLKYINWRNILIPAAASTVVSYFAVEFMKTQDDGTMRLILGVFLICLSVYFMFFSCKIKIRATWYTGLIAGALSGVMGGLFAMGGPPMVIYFMQSEKDINCYMGTIQGYFLLSGVFTVLIKAAAGFVTPNVMLLWLVGLIGLPAGILIGRLIHRKIDACLIRRLVYAVMALSGAVNIVSYLV